MHFTIPKAAIFTFQYPDERDYFGKEMKGLNTKKDADAIQSSIESMHKYNWYSIQDCNSFVFKNNRNRQVLVSWLITGVVIGILLIAVLLVCLFRPLLSACSTSAPLSEAYYAEFNGNRFYYDLYSTQEGNPPARYTLTTWTAERWNACRKINP